ncbi:hypothetical protein ABZS29_26195 [Kribbella sp. NPDC005582]|uniref:hypothetical protein n=1 Tax=Kribbella sp. NPDC005582 TaxID=3156893 RepID=UPI0033BA1123
MGVWVVGEPSDAPSAAGLEAALRWLATRRHAVPLELLHLALQDPTSESGVHLESLVKTVADLPDMTTELRALAVWGVIIDLVRQVGSDRRSRRRNVLIAAFRLPPPDEVTGPWKPVLGARFDQLMALKGVYGDPQPTTNTPMHQAWSRALRENLVPGARTKLAELVHHRRGWDGYVQLAREVEAELARDPGASGQPIGYRSPSATAQPVFVDLFVTTVFMKKRTAYRRITERLITSQVDDLSGYKARALASAAGDPPELSVRPLWGCTVEPMSPVQGREEVTVRLRFAHPLARNEKYYFSSEAIDEHLTAPDRIWVNVEVDHHGIAPGGRLGGHIPTSGLTIRIRFDESELPAACWWYAEATDRERREQPPDGDPHLLKLSGGAVEHTFADKCHPRENYGVSILWTTE